MNEFSGNKTLATIQEISDKGTQLKIKALGADGSHTYTLWKTKKDGNPTQAYTVIKNKTIGQQVEFAWETYQGEYNGKPYTSRTVKFISEQQAPTVSPQYQKVFKPAQPTQPTKENVDWDKIAEGKVRNSVAVAFINNQSVFGEETIGAMNEWVNWIMTGKKKDILDNYENYPTPDEVNLDKPPY